MSADDQFSSVQLSNENTEHHENNSLNHSTENLLPDELPTTHELSPNEANSTAAETSEQQTAEQTSDRKISEQEISEQPDETSQLTEITHNVSDVLNSEVSEDVPAEHNNPESTEEPPKLEEKEAKQADTGIANFSKLTDVEYMELPIPEDLLAPQTQGGKEKAVGAHNSSKSAGETSTNLGTQDTTIREDVQDLDGSRPERSDGAFNLEGDSAKVSKPPANVSQAQANVAYMDHWKEMEMQFQKYELSLFVSNPISDRDGNSKLFISYLITTKTNHPEVLQLLGLPISSDLSEIKVRRRYGDFRFLSECLNNDFPFLLAPPLPPKLNFKYLTGDTFSSSFVHKRLNSLSRFISFIAEHKILSQLSVFHYFVSDSAEWSTFTNNLRIARGDENDSLIVGKVVNEELLTETVMNFFTPSKHKRETNKDILEISDKLKKLYENLVRLHRIFSRLNKKNYDLKLDYEQFLVQINKLSAIQNQNLKSAEAIDPNISNISSLDASAGTTANFKVFSESLLYFLDHWSKLHRHIDENFLVALKNCAKYIVKFSGLIELQNNKKIDLQVLQDYLAKSRAELASLGGVTGTGGGNFPKPSLIAPKSGGIVNNTTQLIKDTLSTSATAHIGSSQSDSKRMKLEHKIAQLEREIVDQTLVVKTITGQIINEEYPYWDNFNKRQLKQSMVDLCDEQISFYKDLVGNWTSVEEQLLKRLEELST